MVFGRDKLGMIVNYVPNPRRRIKELLSPLWRVPGLCTMCEKENHGANQCHLKYHKDNTPLMGSNMQASPQAQQTTGHILMLACSPRTHWVSRVWLSLMCLKPESTVLDLPTAEQVTLFGRA